MKVIQAMVLRLIFCIYSHVQFELYLNKDIFLCYIQENRIYLTIMLLASPHGRDLEVFIKKSLINFSRYVKYSHTIVLYFM